MKKRANALPRAAWALLGLECLVLVALLYKKFITFQMEM